MQTRRVDEIIWRKDLYPRFDTIPSKVQEYAENVELLPPVEVNQHNVLINGYHRWTAHRKEKIEEISVIVTQTASDAELLALAYERNAHGTVALSREEKKHGAIVMYADGTGKTEEEIASLLHVKPSTVKGYLARTKKETKARRDKRIWAAWLACYTEQEIADKEQIDESTVSVVLKNLEKSDTIQKFKVFANYQDPDWEPPLYNVWKQQKKSNKVSHYGNSESSLLDRLLYLYTEPFDIVVDPFGGGGSTVDVCKKRLRRYWVSDRLPVVERPDIRQHDILDGTPSLHKRWGQVKLLYLDPPYWKQAEGEYSKDARDLANMPLEEFYSTLVKFIADCASKMHAGSHVAMLMQPTQWRAPNKEPIDHIIDLIHHMPSDSLKLAIRISTPYESQQYNAQQVKWAKENRRVLVLSREIIVWEII